MLLLTVTSSSSRNSVAEELELQIGTKHTYTCRYLLDSHVQNAQYCLVLPYVNFEIQNQVVPGYPGTPRDRLSRGSPGHVPGVSRDGDASLHFGASGLCPASLDLAAS